uniref:Uncharacterized protein n=1 Tax=Thelephora ganbajun TaxID=370292 RepID=A0A343B753_THEGA|nr:hypothetical protein [Thelephora ganbajun]
MLFNNDAGMIVTAVIVFGMFTYSFYNNIFTTVHKSDSLVNTLPKLDSNVQLDILPSHGYVDAAVQTESKSLWQNFKDWLRDVFSVNTSEVGTFGHDAVDNWRNNLDSIQSVSLLDSETPITSPVGLASDVEKALAPIDSASNISEVVSESNLQNLVGASNSVYDINIYNQEFLFKSLNDISNYIDYSYVIDGVTQAVLVTTDKILTFDPNIVVYPFIC